MQDFEVKFLERSAPLGVSDHLTYEMALPPADAGTWVVLRDVRKHEDRTPVLTACFEYIANVLKVELAHARRLPAPLRFFQCRYELKAGGVVSWALREVLLAQKDGLYHSASWNLIDELTLGKLNASLNLSESPAKLT